MIDQLAQNGYVLACVDGHQLAVNSDLLICSAIYGDCVTCNKVLDSPFTGEVGAIGVAFGDHGVSSAGAGGLEVIDLDSP